MSVETIVGLFVTFILPLLSVDLIKRLLRAGYRLLTGQFTNLPYGLKLGLGIVSAVFFALMAQTGFEPRLVPYVNPILTITLALAANKIYDLLHHMKKP